MRKIVILIAVVLCLAYRPGPFSSLGQRKTAPKTVAQPSIVRPNVVLILSDDLGYGDLGSYGSQKNLTPQIDTLAKRGVRFTDFHSASGMCSPARIGILTGRSPARFGMTREFKETREEFLLREAI